jgi:hypothetical protein
MLASVVGMYILRLSDGTTCDIPMYFCPSLSDTIISPQHFTTMDASNRLFNGYCLIDLPGCCRVLLSRSDTHDAAFIDLQKCNNLYFIVGSASVSSRSLISRVTTKPQLLSELWHQRLGHPGPTQLSALVKHSTGLPPHLTAVIHPMHSCQACNDGKIQRAPMGLTSDTAPIVSASRFHLDFGFIRASSHDFGVTKGPRVVTSYDRNNTYLLIVDAKQRYSWVFCQPSKSPPVSILERFLAVRGLKEGPRSLCMDQGGELWGSDQLRDIAHAAGYVIEPTGSDSAWQNGKVERLNGTFGVMVRCLLYSAGLSAKFWSAALIHAVYLKNRLYHKAIGQTPYEGWTGIKPELDHLRTFGALVTSRKPGKRPSKADRHTAHGVLLGFGSSTKHVRYFDLTTNREKLSSHHVID